MDYNSYAHDTIYEPLKEYDKIIRDMHNDNVKTYFQKLVEKAGTDKEANKATVKDIRRLEEDAKKASKSRAKWNGFRMFLYIVAIILVLAGVYVVMKGGVGPILIGVALFLAAIGSIVLNVVKINKIIKNLKLSQDEIEKQIQDLYKIAWGQTQSLNELFKVEMAPELFRKTLPNINLDQQFDSKRLDYLVNKFGLNNDVNINRSTLYVQSGDINGNPFYISNNLYHRLGTKVYTGSIVIHWTTTSVNSKGQTTVNHHSQTLTATVEKPCPYYATKAFLVYGNEAAPDLVFTRNDSDAEIMTDKQIDKHVNKEIKKIQKSTKKDPNAITILGNQEFEVLWKAQDRNNEVQFRLLFTVLAQRELLALMKDKTIGFGDDFEFIKNKMINKVIPDHLAKFDLNITPNYFHSYDFVEIENKFQNYQNNYMKHIYFTLAPILAIPLYQQHKPREYIYKDLYDSYVSFYEHEKVANMVGEQNFKHPLSGTRNILKTSSVKSNDFCDYVTVTAYGYETIPRVTNITKMGGDGKMHTIPVHWIEYIPVSENTDIEIHVPKEEKELTYEQRVRKMFEDFKNIKDGKDVDEKTLFKLSTFLVLLNKKNKKEE